MEEKIGFFEQPIVRSGMWFVGMLAVYGVLGWFVDAKRAPFAVFTDTLLIAGGLLFWVVFFAQFVLPLRTLGQRWRAVDRLITYLLGNHGPAIFVSNGVVHASESERRKRGAGLIWLDSASAALLRTDVSFTRAIGPGVHFTNSREYIAATVDLHILTQAIGPEDSHEPFLVSEGDPDYQMLQERRRQTSAITRDGIEVVATLTINFRIDADDNEGGTPFGYREESVRRAIIACITPETKQMSVPVWSMLPSKMAADLWREYLRKFKFNQLFEPLEGQNKNHLQWINDQIKERMQKPMVNELDDFGRLTGSQITSKEFQQLQDIGVRIVSVMVRRVVFRPDVEEQLISRWTNLWLKTAQKERDQVARQRRITESTGRDDAVKAYAVDATAEFAQVLPEEGDKLHALYMLIHSTFNRLRRNTHLLNRASPNNTEQADLLAISEWVRSRRGGRG